jgi:glycosyltransferase involved in cell wall biosynthesis
VQTTLSVIVPTRNRPESLTEALASLANQRLTREELQVIVVNDGGEEVNGVLHRFRDVLRVELIAYPTGAGPSHARNLAIDASEGRYLAFLDDDDVLLPGHFRATLEVLEQGGADLVYTTLMVATSRAPAGMSHESGGWPAFDIPFDAEFLHVTNYIPPLGVTLRSPRERGIRFDPNLWVVEDWDFWLQLLNEHQYRFGHLERATGVYHRLPRYDSAADPPKETARVLRLFYDAYRERCTRWPLPESSRGAVCRGHVRHMYELAFARLASGKLLPSFWYERMVRLVHAEYLGELGPGEIRDRLARAMNG